MTEALRVDTDVLDAANAILKSAAGQIPTQLPQFSVNGSDPLSAAIAAGSAQMEAPMAALPGIQAEAKTVAGNIGVAGQKYRETDEMLAQKAKQQQFAKTDSAPTTVQLVDHKTAPPPQPTPTPTPPIPTEIQKRLDEQQKQIDELTEKAKGSPVSDAASSFMNGCVAGAGVAGITGAVTGPVDGPIIIGGCIVGGAASALGKLAEEWTTNVLDAG